MQGFNRGDLNIQMNFGLIFCLSCSLSQVISSRDLRFLRFSSEGRHSSIDREKFNHVLFTLTHFHLVLSKNEIQGFE